VSAKLPKKETDMPNKQYDVCTNNFHVSPGDTFDWTNHRSQQCTVTPCDPNNWPLTLTSYPVPAKTGGNNGTYSATVSNLAQNGTYYFDCDCCAGCPPALGNPKSITIP